MNQVRAVRFGVRIRVNRRNGRQNVATLCLGDRSWSGCAQSGWINILPKTGRGHRDNQRYENESTPHCASLADRGEAVPAMPRRQYCPKVQALSLELGWSAKMQDTTRLESQKRGCGPL